MSRPSHVHKSRSELMQAFLDAAALAHSAPSPKPRPSAGPRAAPGPTWCPPNGKQHACRRRRRGTPSTASPRCSLHAPYRERRGRGTSGLAPHITATTANRLQGRSRRPPPSSPQKLQHAGDNVPLIALHIY